MVQKPRPGILAGQGIIRRQAEMSAINATSQSSATTKWNSDTPAIFSSFCDSRWCHCWITYITRSAKHHKKACTTSGSRPILITDPWKDAWTWCRFKVNYLGLIILPQVEMNSMLKRYLFRYMCYKIKKIMGCFKLEEAK